MPYIKKRRGEFNQEAVIIGERAENSGELNFAITAILHRYIEKNGLKYSTINETIGVLECVKLELYRMVAAKYENKKRRENGAISELDAIQLEEVR